MGAGLRKLRLKVVLELEEGDFAIQSLTDILDNRKMFEQTFKNIDDVLWKEAGCTTELDYTEQTSWLLFLKYLDDLE